MMPLPTVKVHGEEQTRAYWEALLRDLEDEVRDLEGMPGEHLTDEQHEDRQDRLWEAQDEAAEIRKRLFGGGR